VCLSVLDGGQLNGDGSGLKTVELEEGGKFTFTFQVTEQDGLHRVTLRRGKDVKVLEFWVGERLAVSEK